MHANRSGIGARVVTQWLGMLLAGWLAAGTAAAEPVSWYVVTNSVAEPDGESWATAFTNVQDALDNVTPGVTNIIHLAGHTFDLTNALSWAGQTNVIIRGGYNAETEVHDPANQVTMLRRDAAYGDFRVMLMENLDDCRLEHVTVTGGHHIGGATDGGGGIRANHSDVTIVDCVIRDNEMRSNAFRNWGSGGGLYVDHGTVVVRKSRIENNRVYQGNQTSMRGGGAYLANGSLRIEHSMIVSNVTEVYRHGSPVSTSAGVGHAAGRALTIRNCLIAFNENRPHGTSQAGAGAGVILENGGVVESCTIVGNYTTYNAPHGAGLRVDGGTVTNTIVFGNLRGVAPDNIGFGESASEADHVHYSCAPELAGDINNNTFFNPMFIDAAAGDFRLDRASPCVNTGYEAAWMDEGVDLDGNPRIQDGRPDRPKAPDMGAYETLPLPVEGDLVCDFVADVSFGVSESLDVVLYALVGGENTNNLTYRWDFTNDGNFVVGGPVITNTYFAGRHSVRLEVENDQTPSEIATLTRTGYIYVASPIAHVWLDADGDMSGVDWDNAYTNVQTAIDQPGVSKVRMAGGDYALTVQLTWADHSGVTMRGGYDPLTGNHDPESQATILRQTAADQRVLLMEYLDECRLEYVTITGGHSRFDGGGIRANHSDVTIANCIIRDNELQSLSSGSSQWGSGGGLYVNHGSVVVQNSRIENNLVWRGNQSHMRGGGIYLANGSLLVTHSMIVSNVTEFYTHGSPTSTSAGIGHAAGSALTIRNCLIAFNENRPYRTQDAGQAGPGAGVVLEDGGVIESSTIVGNHTTSETPAGAGLRVNGGSVTNTIVWDNTRAEEVNDVGFGAGINDADHVFYSLAPELTQTGAPNHNLADDPLFVDPVAGDFRLQLGSPAIDTGINQPWMIGAVDLTGLPRILKRAVDRGAYETIPPRGSLVMIR